MAIAVYVSVATVISIIRNKAGQLIRKTYHISDGAQVSISTMHSRFTLESKWNIDCLSEAGSEFLWNDGQSIFKKKRLQKKHSLLSGVNHP